MTFLRLTSMLALATVSMVSTACYVEHEPEHRGAYAPPPPPPPEGQVVVEQPPPPPPAPQPDPVAPPPPTPDDVWIGGQQRWNGQTYSWQPAHYEHRPRPNARHANGHWEKRAKGSVWVDAHWE